MTARTPCLVCVGDGPANRRMELAIEHGVVVLGKKRPGHLYALALAFAHELETAPSYGQRVWLSVDEQVHPQLQVRLDSHNLAEQQALFLVHSAQ